MMEMACSQKLRVVGFRGSVLQDGDLDVELAGEEEPDFGSKPQQPVLVGEDRLANRAGQEGFDEAGDSGLLAVESTASVGDEGGVLGVVADTLGLSWKVLFWPAQLTRA